MKFEALRNGDLKPSTKVRRVSIVPGGAYAGHGISPPVRILVAISVP